jgi:Uma2 family endonuclease
LQVTTVKYVLDPADPRAPTTEQWAALSESERKRIVAQLPSEFPRETAPEGDRHRIPKEKAVDSLGEYFRRMGRRVYLSAELPVYYPGERWFAPDLLAVVDVDPHSREKWVVEAEKRGLDLVVEITLSGDRKKDLVDNVERYGRIGIPEYFVLDLIAHRIFGYRLGNTKVYEPIVPQAGRWSSQVLGLDLTLENGKIRFYSGSAALLESDELIGRLSTMLDELVQKEQDIALALDDARQRAEDAEQRANDAEARVQRLAEQLRKLGVSEAD